MKKNIGTWLCALLVFIALPFTVVAKQTEKINDSLYMEELTIQVLPEFAYHPEDEDKEELSVLVSYNGTYKNETDEPVKGEIAIPLPVEDKGFQVGYVGDYNAELTQRNDLEYEVNKEEQTVTWKTSDEVQPGERYKFVIEYYTSDIEADGENKQLTYKFTKFEETGMLNLFIVEPLKTAGFEMSPTFESHQQNQFGMNMFYFPLKDLDIGNETEIEVSYKRNDPLVSTEILQQIHTELQGMQENETPSLSSTIAIIGGISVVAIAILIFILMKRKNKPSPAEKANKRNSNETDDDKQLKVARLRAMLIDGKITEEEYEELLKNLGG